MSMKNPMGWTRDFHYWSVLVVLALAGLTILMYLFSYHSHLVGYLVGSEGSEFCLSFFMHTFSFRATAPCM